MILPHFLDELEKLPGFQTDTILTNVYELAYYSTKSLYSSNELSYRCIEHFLRSYLDLNLTLSN